MIGLFLVAMFTGCNHDESPEAVDLGQTSVPAEFVSADEATTIATAVQFGSAEATTAGGKATTRSTGLNKEVESVTSVPDASGATVFYVINYKGGGFMILSADKRVDPVLAFSETSTFPVNKALYLEGLADWITSVKKHISTVRKNNLLLTEEMKGAWDTSSIQTMFGPPHDSNVPWIPDNGDPSNPCHDKYLTAGPLMKTTWEQENGYNDFTPALGCDNRNGRAPVGCTALAVGQVMKYIRHPRSYNWNAMKDDKPTKETAKLLSDIGVASQMDYKCNGSGAWLNIAASAMVNKFGYSSAQYGDFDVEKLAYEIVQKKTPVILQGYTGQDQQLGHAWVCDGYRRIVKFTFCKPHITEYLYMNWGWGGVSNGWFTLDDKWSGFDLKYHRKMVYNIRP